MSVSPAFKATIDAHLQGRAQADELFAATLAKEGKSLDDCCTYILNQVQQSGQQGFADEEIFGMAVHYYDEDNIEVGKATNARVVVNHTVELTAEEKEQAHKTALANAVREAEAKIMKKPVAKAKAKPVQSTAPAQVSLF